LRENLAAVLIIPSSWGSQRAGHSTRHQLFSGAIIPAIKDQIEPIDNLSDLSFFMPIKCLKKQKKKPDTMLGVAVRRSTRINKTIKIKK
jgi:hypothetical protein